ncbi:calmodulin binding protein PICBP-like [Punica granatum]|uniref:Calmodulin-binding domain-containing protein n=2 Tax=Punica granatum TaxID=22663 RepID=A0A218WZV5_PUNGR|nr:calmodulin binding protein PICBP-like [Punica granatum]OWM78435.1 hypothetical protein CDL15_Pgr016159 [Punica granatum]PKI63000.1 hypothetical protein CRG98_016639 [Punica granatum]
MVQRKVHSSKLGIKADHRIKPDPGSSKSKTIITPSSPQYYPDGKTSRASDLKKKMKRSRPIKRSNIDSLRSFSLGTGVPQPGRPPPLGLQVSNSSATTPQKHPHVRSGDGLPNYMKPTSSSDARKERSSVSPPSTRVSSDSKSTRRVSSASSKVSSPSGNNSKITPVRNLKRSSSSRLVRTLTKTPSFKPARSSSAKRCSTVVLCGDMNAQRATCSSTLKDSKFPKYLNLSPGATEAEGTSAMKVCPYTYCSLNGHRHSPLPPLKCFISSRRRAMKTQRSLKVEALKTEIEEPTPVYGPTRMDADNGGDFFIEIYAETEDRDTCSQESFHEEEKKSEVQEEVDLPISVLEEALAVESFLGKDGSEVEFPESVEELGSESLDMEWDGDPYSNFDLEEAADDPTENEACPKTQKPELCPDFLLIGWKNIPDEEAQQEEDEACPEAQFPEDQVSEISELSQVLDCFSYDQYSSPEEDELEEATADAEETAVSLTEEHSADLAESIGIDPVLHKPQENQDDAITGFSFKPELENSSSQSQCLCQEQEGTAVDAVNKDVADESPKRESQYLLSNEQQSQISDLNKSQNLEMLDIVSDEMMKIPLASEDPVMEVDREEAENHTQSSIAEEAFLESRDTDNQKKSKYTRPERDSKQDTDPSMNWIGKNRCKRLSEEEENSRRFNPRDPNYLPIVLDPEAEKVDLRHQMIDERRNSDEWMIDYVLRQTVTRLAPARKRKVALLVEAFEKVIPAPKMTPNSKWETHLTSPRPVQACS